MNTESTTIVETVVEASESVQRLPLSPELVAFEPNFCAISEPDRVSAQTGDAGLRRATPHVRKPYFSRFSTDRRQAGLEMAARIVDHLGRGNKNTMPLSDLKRALHAHRHPEKFRDAVSQLVRYGMATVRDGWLTLRAAEGIALPQVYRRLAELKHQRKRGRTEWFEENRSKMDLGQHSNFGEDWGDEDSDAV